MAEKKEHLQKLLLLVNQVANEPGNEWFKNELVSNFGGNLERVLNETEKSIKKIDEHFFKKIATKQAENFYKDFKLTTIKDKLIADFVRMEQFRREDNFEDFSLALHQQIENIINQLTENNILFREAIIQNRNTQTYSIRNQKSRQFEHFNLSQLIVSNLVTQEKIDSVFTKDIFVWDYPQKLKSIIYFYVFNQKIFNYYDFKTIYDIGNDIYQARNLNHRGGFLYDNQISTLNRIDSSKDKYYFKFLGFLETLVTKLNDKL